MATEKSSYEKINYSLRPAKAIERKMLCEAMRRLSFIQNIDRYRYIGFGSTYFSDFNLVHKSLGIKDLISIEKDEQNADRFIFNQPFSCIELKFDLANNILPEIKWNKLSILWLDYDYKLDKTMFADIETFFFSAKAGSLFIITVDVKPDSPESEIDNEKIQIQCTEEELKKYRIEKLVERVGTTKIPPKVRNINLNIENNPRAIYQIINDQILEVINKRNGGLNEKDKIDYKQLFHFIYDDGTLMLTVGGLIYNQAQIEIIEKKRFDDLYFIRTREIPFSINVPSLTFKEIQLLDSLLPEQIDKSGKIRKKKKSKLNIPKLPVKDIQDYAEIYRYFPTFAEANF